MTSAAKTAEIYSLHFDPLYEIDAKHAYDLASAFAASNSMDEVYAILRFLNHTSRSISLFEYLQGCHFQDVVDGCGEFCGDFGTLKEEAEGFCLGMEESHLVTWRAC